MTCPTSYSNGTGGVTHVSPDSQFVDSHLAGLGGFRGTSRRLLTRVQVLGWHSILGHPSYLYDRLVINSFDQERSRNTSSTMKLLRSSAQAGEGDVLGESH